MQRMKKQTTASLRKRLASQQKRTQKPMVKKSINKRTGKIQVSTSQGVSIMLYVGHLLAVYFCFIKFVQYMFKVAPMEELKTTLDPTTAKVGFYRP